MASIEFQTFKLSDEKLIAGLKKIAAEIPDDQAMLYITLAHQHSNRISTLLSDADEDESIKLLITAETSLAWQVQVQFPNLQNASIVITREPGSDKVTVTIANNADNISSIKFISTAHKYLKAYERTESLDKVLGDELAEFYRKREEGILRLEALNQKLIEQNEEYRKKVDLDKEEFESEIKAEYKILEKKLDDDKESNELAIKGREEKLLEREESLDDRDSKHARRQIRNDLKSALEARANEFTLTKKTTKKRLPIHFLFLLLILISSGFLAQILLTTKISSDDFYWWPTLKLTFTAFALIASIIFYIKWNDSWFRQHADEEFRLKRLELDIDRASWVVEMALEWNEEQGNELPNQLVERLTNNLFISETKTNSTSHPSEDLTSALISASSGMSIKIPGVGELAIDRKGLNKFRKGLDD